MNKKICVVGAGYWGFNHIKSLHKLGVSFGVVERNADRLSYILSKYPNVSGYQSLDEALNEKYDGFSIVTPAETHFDIAKFLISRGKHVLVEKPMAMSVDDAKKLVYLAEKHKVNLMVGHVLLFHPAVKKIKRMIENGDIGELQYIYSNRLNLGKVRTEENAFWSLAPHDIAIFQFLTNSQPKSIKSIGSSFLQKGIQDSTLTHLEYCNGVKGHIFVSWLHPFKEHRLIVIGSEAMISFEDSHANKPLKLYSKKFNFCNGVPKKFDGPVKFIAHEDKMPLEIELAYFIDHLDGKPLKISDMYHGLQVVKTLVEASRQL